MRRLSYRHLIPFFLLLIGCGSFAAEKNPFLVKPYLQLGNAPLASANESLQLLWQTEASSGDWSVSIKPASAKANRKLPPPVVRPVALGDQHYVYLSTLDGLKPGEAFEYQVSRGNTVEFSSQGHARVEEKSPYQFAVFGDCGADTSGEKELATEMLRFKPDFAFLTGDLVYSRGTAHDYLSKFFAIYNADEADRKSGAPLMRSVLFLGALGNHDVAARDLDSSPDGLAFFYNWSLPLNGLESFERPGFKASADKAAAMKAASGGAFPRMSNYSFAYGNSFWLVLDSNADVDWSKPEMKQWVAEQLTSAPARKAQWRFVGFHHPGFHSSHIHAGDQWMRVLSKTFEDAKVDVVFAGHVHNYQRSYPLRFETASEAPAKNHHLDGKWTLDTQFDGKAVTKANGVVYVVSGAGGAMLYDKGQGADRKSWLEFTQQFVSDVHSFTAVQINGARMSVRQIDTTGKVVDEFSLTK